MADRNRGDKNDDCHGQRYLDHQQELCPQGERSRISKTELCARGESQENVIPESGLPIFPTWI